MCILLLFSSALFLYKASDIYLGVTRCRAPPEPCVSHSRSVYSSCLFAWHQDKRREVGARTHAAARAREDAADGLDMRESDTMGGGDDFHERLARSKMGQQRRQAAKMVRRRWERRGGEDVFCLEIMENLGKGSMVNRGLLSYGAGLISLFPRPSTHILTLPRHLF